MLGNGSTIPISKSNLYHTQKLHLNELLLEPQLEKNFISFKKKLYEDNSVSFKFYPDNFSMKDLATKISLLTYETK